MTHDLIVVWPNFLDYPLFRIFLLNYGPLFNNILIMVTEQNLSSYDYTNGLREWMVDEILKTRDTNIVVEGPLITPENEDWRDWAVNTALQHSGSDYLWFMEQDFFADWSALFGKIANAIDEGVDAVGFYEESTERLHPAFMVISKEVLEQTCMDFSPHPKRDHFGHISADLEEMEAEIITLEELGLKGWRYWYHMQSLTYSYQQVIMGGQPTFNVADFLVYNHRARTANVKQFDAFLELSHKAEQSITDLAKLLALIY